PFAFLKRVVIGEPSLLEIVSASVGKLCATLSPHVSSSGRAKGHGTFVHDPDTCLDRGQAVAYGPLKPPTRTVPGPDTPPSATRIFLRSPPRHTRCNSRQP